MNGLCKGAQKRWIKVFLIHVCKTRKNQCRFNQTNSKILISYEIFSTIPKRKWNVDQFLTLNYFDSRDFSQLVSFILCYRAVPT